MQSFVADRLWFKITPLSYLNGSEEAQTVNCTMVMDKDEVLGETSESEQYAVYQAAVNVFDNQVYLDNEIQVLISASTIQKKAVAEGIESVKKNKENVPHHQQHIIATDQGTSKRKTNSVDLFSEVPVKKSVKNVSTNDISSNVEKPPCHQGKLVFNSFSKILDADNNLTKCFLKLSAIGDRYLKE